VHPDRCVIGHHSTHPHVVPLVEIVAGERPRHRQCNRRSSFTPHGKKPIHLRKEVVGHLSEPSASALYREVVYLIGRGGVCSTSPDADAARVLGARPALGCHGTEFAFHLGAGEGGIQHFMDHLSGPVASCGRLGPLTEFTPEVKKTIIDGVD